MKSFHFADSRKSFPLQQNVWRHLIQSLSLSRTQVLSAPRSAPSVSGLFTRTQTEHACTEMDTLASRFNCAQPIADSSQLSLAMSHHHDLHLFHTGVLRSQRKVSCSIQVFCVLMSLLLSASLLLIFTQQVLSVHGCRRALDKLSLVHGCLRSHSKTHSRQLLLHSSSTNVVPCTLFSSFTSFARVFFFYSRGSCLANLACTIPFYPLTSASCKKPSEIDSSLLFTVRRHFSTLSCPHFLTRAAAHGNLLITYPRSCARSSICDGPPSSCFDSNTFLFQSRVVSLSALASCNPH